MKPMNIIYTGMLFVAVVVSAGGWYGGMVTDYAYLNTSLKINVSEARDTAIYTQVNDTQRDMEKGLRTSISRVPVLGSVVLFFFTPIQMITSFLFSLWDGLSIGAEIITGLIDLIPWVINDTIRNLVYMAITFMFLGSLVYLITGRKVE